MHYFLHKKYIQQVLGYSLFVISNTEVKYSNMILNALYIDPKLTKNNNSPITNNKQQITNYKLQINLLKYFVS